jgi:hypothetical protein
VHRVAGVNCPRCGRAQPPDAEGVFCVHCGQFLVRTRWVALPPESAAGSTPPAERRGRYSGPPRYLSPPRWGFPALPWRLEKPATPPSSASIAAGHAGLLVPLLRGLALLAALSGAAEIWRYVLLLRSRGEALDAGQVAASDALVEAASWVCTVLGVAVGVYLLLWVLRVIEAAAERSGVRPARGRRMVLIGWIVPVLNISVPGSVLAEVEHAALGRPAGQRPRPSRLLLLWWALWAANVALSVFTVLWSLRSGVQARANGVELHALVDLLAAATAVVSAKVVLWLTALVGPPKSIPLPRVVSVREPAGAGRATASTVLPR